VAEVARKITPYTFLMPGRELLAMLLGPFSVVYLDGFDWIPAGAEEEGWIDEARARYELLGLTLSNRACQEEHLAEAQQVVRRATARCRIILDDTWRGPRGWDGKGGLAVPFLLAEGYLILGHARPNKEKGSLGFTMMQAHG
jgi:hypothetical protein